jgi:hypothetical protein
MQELTSELIQWRLMRTNQVRRENTDGTVVIAADTRVKKSLMVYVLYALLQSWKLWGLLST